MKADKALTPDQIRNELARVNRLLTHEVALLHTKLDTVLKRLGEQVPKRTLSPRGRQLHRPQQAPIPDRVPAYLRVEEIARACGETTRAMRRQLSRAGLLERDGRLYRVGESRLRERLPGVHDRVWNAYTILVD